MIRRIWKTLMTGDPMLVMVTVFCGAYALLMAVAIVVVFVVEVAQP